MRYILVQLAFVLLHVLVCNTQPVRIPPTTTTAVDTNADMGRVLVRADGVHKATLVRYDDPGTTGGHARRKYGCVCSSEALPTGSPSHHTTHTVHRFLELDMGTLVALLIIAAAAHPVREDAAEAIPVKQDDRGTTGAHGGCIIA
ncbi:hypothetical protein C8Q74DRAFT_1222483 [Fomes fomentarius]|nr:hypothetical protein C8Q74DRAFT_1222483 [Fomes fomentarius]